MRKADLRIIELAVCLAAMMHLWLFLGTRMLNRTGLAGVPVSPATHYLGPSSDGMPAADDPVRTVWSPVLFSLPSELGFSRDLLQEKLRARLTFRQPDNTESFLKLDPHARDTHALIAPEEIMLTTGRGTAPRPPPGLSAAAKDPPSPRRVYVTPQLKERLVGGIVLPPELNQPKVTAWEVRADVSVTEEGFVRHVFLTKPLDEAPLNQSVIRLLHGLHFRPGKEPTEGRIEIYSPETSPAKGGER